MAGAAASFGAFAAGLARRDVADGVATTAATAATLADGAEARESSRFWHEFFREHRDEFARRADVAEAPGNQDEEEGGDLAALGHDELLDKLHGVVARLTRELEQMRDGELLRSAARRAPALDRSHVSSASAMSIEMARLLPLVMGVRRDAETVDFPTPSFVRRDTAADDDNDDSDDADTTVRSKRASLLASGVDLLNGSFYDDGAAPAKTPARTHARAPVRVFSPPSDDGSSFKSVASSQLDDVFGSGNGSGNGDDDAGSSLASIGLDSLNHLVHAFTPLPSAPPSQRTQTRQQQQQQQQQSASAAGGSETRINGVSPGDFFREKSGALGRLTGSPLDPLDKPRFATPPDAAARTARVNAGDDQREYFRMSGALTTSEDPVAHTFASLWPRAPVPPVARSDLPSTVRQPHAATAGPFGQQAVRQEHAAAAGPFEQPDVRLVTQHDLLSTMRMEPALRHPFGTMHEQPAARHLQTATAEPYGAIAHEPFEQHASRQLHTAANRKTAPAPTVQQRAAPQDDDNNDGDDDTVTLTLSSHRSLPTVLHGPTSRHAPLSSTSLGATVQRGDSSNVVVLAPSSAGMSFGAVATPQTREVVVVNVGRKPAYVRALVKAAAPNNALALDLNARSITLEPNRHVALRITVKPVRAYRGPVADCRWMLDVLSVDHDLRVAAATGAAQQELLNQATQVHRLDVSASTAGTGDGTGEVELVPPSDWHVSPRALAVGPADAVPPGWTVVVTNTSDVDIVFEASWPAAHLDVFPATARVPAHAGRKLHVTPLNLSGRTHDWRGRITIAAGTHVHHVDVAIAASRLTVNGRVGAPSQQPSVVSVPTSANFPAVLVGRSAERFIVVENRSAEPQTVQAAVSGSAFALAAGHGASLSVGSRSAAQIPLLFRPAAEGRFEGKLSVTTSGGATTTCFLFGLGVVGSEDGVAPAQAASVSGSLRADRAVLDFGSVPYNGVAVVRHITLANHSDVNCTVVVCGLRQDEGLFRVSEEHQVIPLRRRQFVKVPVTFVPPTSAWERPPGRHETSAVFVSDADPEPVYVSLSATVAGEAGALSRSL